jgi:hypothetical protein
VASGVRPGRQRRVRGHRKEGRQHLEQEREGGDLFKEQASISFLSWNSNNAPIFIVPSAITHQAI